MIRLLNTFVTVSAIISFISLPAYATESVFVEELDTNGYFDDYKAKCQKKFKYQLQKQIKKHMGKNGIKNSETASDSAWNLQVTILSAIKGSFNSMHFETKVAMNKGEALKETNIKFKAASSLGTLCDAFNGGGAIIGKKIGVWIGSELN